MSFALAINCMDGRVQLPVILYLKESFSVDYIDIVTEAGVVQHLSSSKKTPLQQSILDRAFVSVERHSSKSIAVVAHYDCVGNPVADDLQKGQLKKSVDMLKSHFPSCNIIGLWLDCDFKVHHLY